MSLLHGLWGKLAAAFAANPSAAAVKAVERGNAAAQSGDVAVAERCYREAAAIAPRWAVPWFDLGLLFKNARRWRESLEANRRALAIDPAHEGATWNLGIAATALSDWAEARRAWHAYGIEIPDGDGPPALELGPVPVRIAAGEVVWCERLDPARARIASIPFPESGRCRGDVVLHDGAPNGYRKLGEREVPVFDELQLLEPSRLSTWTVEVDLAGPGEAAALAALFERREIPAEDWTVQVHLLCRACSEGRPHAAGEEHAPSAVEWKRAHLFGIAAEGEDVALEVLRGWREGGPGRAHGPLELGLAAEGRSG